MRTLTDAELSLRELTSLEASSVTEERLEDEASEEYKSIIAPLSRLDPPDLIAVIMAVRGRFIEERVRSEFPFRYIPFPDDATEEEKREVLTSRREHEATVRQKRSEDYSTRMAKDRGELEGLDTEELIAKAKNALISTEVFTAKLTEFHIQTIYMACVVDGKPAFDFDVVKNHGTKGGLNDRVFSRLLGVYGEVDTADPWELEKHS